MKMISVDFNSNFNSEIKLIWRFGFQIMIRPLLNIRHIQQSYFKMTLAGHFLEYLLYNSIYISYLSCMTSV
jgi:hypothetical protein